jgi:DNA ligase-1
MKPRADAEARILGFQMIQSANKAIMLGAMTLEGINGKYKGVQFSCGTGFNDLQRIDIWDNKEKYRKMIVKYSYMDYGAKDLPRHPVFEGFRHEDDL